MHCTVQVADPCSDFVDETLVGAILRVPNCVKNLPNAVEECISLLATLVHDDEYLHDVVRSHSVSEPFCFSEELATRMHLIHVHSKLSGATYVCTGDDVGVLWCFTVRAVGAKKLRNRSVAVHTH